MVAAVERGRRLQPPQPATVPSISTTKYVPSSISWRSMPMIALLDSIWSSSRNPRCSCSIAASISGTRTVTSSPVANRMVIVIATSSRDRRSVD
jgi:hypothetical protein